MGSIFIHPIKQINGRYFSSENVVTAEKNGYDNRQCNLVRLCFFLFFHFVGLTPKNRLRGLRYRDQHENAQKSLRHPFNMFRNNSLNDLAGLKTALFQNKYGRLGYRTTFFSPFKRESFISSFNSIINFKRNDFIVFLSFAF